MGFTFNGIHSDTFKLGVATGGMPYIPQKRQTVIDINGRDGQHVFEDGYNNITIELNCAIGGDDIAERRTRARAISAWLASTGTLIFDYESDIEYKVVKSTNNITANIIGREYRDEFSISFECEPYQQQTYYEHERVFTITNAQTITLVNSGTYKALPTIIITGYADDVTIGSFTVTDLYNETIYVDCKNMLVYSNDGDTKTNRMGYFSGNFIELKPGSNDIAISGLNMEVDIEFDYKNTYL